MMVSQHQFRCLQIVQGVIFFNKGGDAYDRIRGHHGDAVQARVEFLPAAERKDPFGKHHDEASQQRVYHHEHHRQAVRITGLPARGPDALCSGREGRVIALLFSCPDLSLKCPLMLVKTANKHITVICNHEEI